MSGPHEERLFTPPRERMRGIDNIVSEADKKFHSKATPEVKEAVRQAKKIAGKTLDQIVAQIGYGAAAKDVGIRKRVRAKYKIEVFFQPGRTVNGPNLCGVMLWESGRRIHGGGDDKMFWCKDNRQGQNEGCWGPIVSDNIKGGLAVCPKCLMAVDAELLTDMRVLRLTTRKLADVIETIFHQLGDNADVYCKYSQDDIRYRAMVMAKGERVARKYKGLHIYTLGNLIQDTAHGASVNNRFYAFLTS
jgi:hypothetical protein